MDKAPVSTSDHEYYLKLIEELNIKYEKMQEWYDAALDWREMEIQRAVNTKSKYGIK